MEEQSEQSIIIEQTRVVKQHPIFEGVQLGIGTWSWGDRVMWGYGKDYRDQDLQAAFDLLIASGVRFFDTASVYGLGRAEQILGSFVKNTTDPVVIGTKFMPFPWRLTKRSLFRALRHSLKRMNIPKVSLYQMHFPLPPIPIEIWMEYMAELVQKDLTSAVGVSNYDRDQMQRAYDTLAQEGIQLASNQLEYHLLNRKIEKNGLLKHCHDLGVTVIAYSPLAMGILSGKYTPQHPPEGLRSARYNLRYLEQVQPLLEKMRQIGAAHAGKTPAQVALNWIICKGAIPIPGVKSIQQAEANILATKWRLTDDEVEALDTLSDEISD